MENDRERPYSVLTRDDLKEKMKKQIEKISEIFCVSRSDATVLLMNLRWDSLRVSERLGEDKEKLLTKSGLKSVVVIDSNRDVSDSVSSGWICLKKCDDDEYVDHDDVIDSNRELSDSSCGICLKTCDEIDDDGDLISTPFCSHKFCTTCWRESLINSMEQKQYAISCPDRDCGAAVGPDTIEKLTIRDKEMYEGYILRSYLEGKSKELMIKLCPAPDCNYAIEFHDDGDEDETDHEEYSLNVVCLCGHTFCWRCRIESHRPVTCNNASDWFSRGVKDLDLDESLSHSWIETNTMSCPNCLSPVLLERGDMGQFLTCTCSFNFCSKCLRTVEYHEQEESGEFKDCVEQKTFKRRLDLDRPCVDRWKAGQISLEEAKSDLKAFEESHIEKPSTLNEQVVRIIREALMLIVQCRQVIKWSCVYDYFHTEFEISKKEYLRLLEDKANSVLLSYSKTIREETQGALSAGNMTYEERCNFKHRLSTATSNIGNHFYHFIKTLQDGLVDVKVKSYDGLAAPQWFCDRCTFGNSWLHKECKMCCDATVSPMEEELSDLSLN